MSQAGSRGLSGWAPWVLVSWLLYESLTPFAVVGGLGVLAENAREFLSGISATHPLEHVFAFGLLGVLVALSGQHRVRHLVGFAICLEVFQICVLDRHPRIADLVINTVSSTAGFVVAIRILDLSFIRRQIEAHSARLARLAILPIAGLIVVTCLQLHRSTSFANWREDFPLRIGDEGTQDRSWKGRVHGVAIYPSTLTEVVVRQLVALPFSSPAGISVRRELGAVALFDMAAASDGWIADQSNLDPPVNLRISPGRPQDQQYLVGADSVEKVTQLLRPGADFSVEILAQSLDLGQSGPARLVSLSEDPLQRNFTVGQQARALHFRVRSPSSGENGIYGEGQWSEIFTDEASHHLVATYEAGRMALFKDATLQRAPLVPRAPLDSDENWELALVFLLSQLGSLSRLGWTSASWLPRSLAAVCGGTLVLAVGVLLATSLYQTELQLQVSSVVLMSPLVGDRLVGWLLRE